MANLTKLLLFIVILNIFLVIFGITDLPGGPLIELIRNPSGWEDLSLIDYVLNSLTILGLAFTAGTLLTGRTDLAIFSGISAAFFTLMLNLVGLWSWVNAQTHSSEVASLIVGPIILIYFMAIFSWWRGRSD